MQCPKSLAPKQRTLSELRQAGSDYGPGSQANTVALQASKAGVPETENTGKIPRKSILNPERQLIVEKEERQEKE